MKKKISKCFILFLTCLFVCTAVSSVFVNAKENQTNKLTITCQNNDIILSNIDWEIYHIADITSDGNYKPTDNFKKYPIKLNGLTTSQKQAAADTFEAYAKTDKITPLQIGTTDSSGIVIFDNLQSGLYLISGNSVIIDDTFYMPAPSLILLNDENEQNASWQYNVTAVPKLKVLPASMRIYRFNCFVQKIWTDDKEEYRPDSINAVLFKDGKEFSSVKLNNENEWKHEWPNLSSESKWTVIEEIVPENYTVTYTSTDINIKNEIEHDTKFIINNTYIQKTPLASSGTIAENKPLLPQTGQLWWPVPILSALGLTIFCTGLKINTNKRNKHEK